MRLHCSEIDTVINYIVIKVNRFVTMKFVVNDNLLLPLAFCLIRNFISWNNINNGNAITPDGIQTAVRKFEKVDHFSVRLYSRPRDSAMALTVIFQSVMFQSVKFHSLSFPCPSLSAPCVTMLLWQMVAGMSLVVDRRRYCWHCAVHSPGDKQSQHCREASHCWLWNAARHYWGTGRSRCLLIRSVQLFTVYLSHVFLELMVKKQY